MSKQNSHPFSNIPSPIIPTRSYSTTDQKEIVQNNPNISKAPLLNINVKPKPIPINFPCPCPQPPENSSSLKNQFGPIANIPNTDNPTIQNKNQYIANQPYNKKSSLQGTNILNKPCLFDSNKQIPPGSNFLNDPSMSYAPFAPIPINPPPDISISPDFFKDISLNKFICINVNKKTSHSKNVDFENFITKALDSSNCSKCYKEGCKNEPVARCTCVGTAIFICKIHYYDHTMEFGNHFIQSLWGIPEQPDQLINFYSSSSIFIEHLIDSLTDYTNKILYEIKKIYKSFIKPLRELSNNYKNIENKLILTKTFPTEDNFYTSTSLSKHLDDVQTLFMSLQEKYQNYFSNIKIVDFIEISKPWFQKMKDLELKNVEFINQGQVINTISMIPFKMFACHLCKQSNVFTDYNLVSCSSSCKICRKCRKQDMIRCHGCSRMYKEDEKALLERA